MSQSQDAGTDPASDPPVSSPPVPDPKYWSCSHEELIALQIEAWALGAGCAKADGSRVLRDLMAIEQRAETACDEALLIYVPLELARFRDVFTLAWVGGYCASRSAGGRISGVQGAG
ncbi:MAG TPA: hypothetical protein VF116_21815 [Ktedonobacterales bacterium]